jgi:hypothetical protein
MVLHLEPIDKRGVVPDYLSDHRNRIPGWPHDEGIIGVRHPVPLSFPSAGVNS